MHSIKINKLITLIMSLYYRISVWHRGNIPTAKEIRIKLFYWVFYLLFLLSLMVGAITNEKVEKKIFLVEVSIEVATLFVKLSFLIWKQSKICDLAYRVCVFSIQDDDDYATFNNKLKKFAKWSGIFAIATSLGAFLSAVLIPFMGTEKTLFLEIGFFLDWKNSDIVFWIAAFFLFVQSLASVMISSFSVIIWYLLFVCSLRYEVLGSELKNLGQNSGIRAKKLEKNHVNFLDDLKTSIDTHLYLMGLTNELGSLFSGLFLIRLGTSGLCICGSIYCLALDVGENTFERVTYLMILFYFISEIFMLTYFGNEIMLSYDQLSYCLFESDWFEQPESTKKCMIIFGEYLKKPLTLMIGKLYPLTLETFTKILNSAYSMFNILQNIQQ
ncbi:odorant receptor 94a-like [Bradysia coprophila]|uniref:odorant receptor 94a-like n=1 Tax=Bradysia coprophila TaxID=38358 RepID=UPI00187D8A33|nr:odorant receptor 94a-like [Bradysia coprophila]